MLAGDQDSVARGRQPVLKHAGIGGLSFGVGADIQVYGTDPGGLVLAKHVVDRDAGEVVRSEHVDRSGAGSAAGNGAGPEGLFIVAPVLFADEAERLSGAEVRPEHKGIGDGGDLRAGVEMLGETGDVGVSVGGEGRIVLVKVLQAERVFFGGVVVNVGHGQVRHEPRGAGKKSVVDVRSGWRGAVEGIVRYEPFAGFTGQRRRIEQYERVVVYVGGGNGQVADVCTERVVAQVRQSIRGTVVGQAHGNVHERVADFLVGDVQVLIRQESKQLVLDDGTADGAAEYVAMQLRDLIGRRNVRILIEEERSGVEPIGAAMGVGSAVPGIGAGGGA